MLQPFVSDPTGFALPPELCGDIVQAVGEGVLTYESAFPHRIRFVNPAAEALIGHPIDGIVGRHVDDVLCLARGAGAAGETLLGRLADGVSFEAQVATPWRAEAFPVAFIAARQLAGAGLVVLTFRDIGAEWHAREGLRLAEQVFEYSPEAILVTDESGTILRVNPAFTLITGYRPEEAVGRNPRILRSDRHDADFYTQLWAGLREEGHWHGEIWDRRKNGEIYPKWLCINAVHLPSGDIRYVALFDDISERKAHEQRIDYLAHHDALTGLANRRQLQKHAAHMLARARRGDAGAALLLIDLDRFKHINDGLGHDIGDLLLVEVGGRLNTAVRASDVVARLGGDEFVVLLEGIADPNEVAPLAEKIRVALASPYEIAGHVLHTSPSIGIGLCPANGENLESLLKAADIAMYQVKAAQRNGWRFFEQKMDDAVRKRHQLEVDLRAALAASQFALHYQPQFDIGGARVIAWEALLRWNHPAHGEVPPDEFIPLAEESGLIVPIGAWVLETACRDAVAWSAMRGGEENVAVNVSAKQIEHGDFVAVLSAILERTGLPARRLELELTESTLFGNTPHMRETLESLRALGVRLTLDDFGTGYSTLAGLTHFSVDRLKIDRGFTANLDKAGNATIVAAIVALAAALKLDVIAEGVETCEQLAFLMDKGCLLAQGFLCGRPMASDAVVAFSPGGDMT
jgi:diguanylate cyclase (GGDEF)-like protein/PAS domain S-box-containing protein